MVATAPVTGPTKLACSTYRMAVSAQAPPPFEEHRYLAQDNVAADRLANVADLRWQCETKWDSSHAPVLHCADAACKCFS